MYYNHCITAYFKDLCILFLDDCYNVILIFSETFRRNNSYMQELVDFITIGYNKKNSHILLFCKTQFNKSPNTDLVIDFLCNFKL